MREQHRHTRAVAVVVLIGYVLAMVLGGLHFLVEQHVKCPHGEWTHVEAGGSVETSLLGPDTVHEDEPLTGKLHGHAHCQVTTFLGETASVVDEVPWHVAFVEGLFYVRASLVESSFCPVRHAYTYAPKTSPPRAA